MLLNWCEEITNIDPSINFRATGGWVKTVTGLDKSVLNGFSLVGEFVKAGDYKSEFSDGLYLDCNKEGKKSNPCILTAIRKERNPIPNRTLGYSD